MPSAKGKKKNKKKRLSLAEKETAALDKAATTLKHSVDQFHLYLDRMDRWLANNHQKAIKLFQTYDVNGTGKLTYSEFKAGLRDLHIFCTAAELHLLCKLLDRENADMVEYNRMAKGLSFVRDREERHRIVDIRPPLPLTHPPFAHCKVCGMTDWQGEPYMEKYPRFIAINLRLRTFKMSPVHPAHIHHTIHSHLTVHHLTHIIRDATSVATTHIVIFPDKSPDSTGLPAEQSLEQCGFMGGPPNAPVPLVLYYDFVVDFPDCPLLMCDFYFGQKVTMNRLNQAIPGSPLSASRSLLGESSSVLTTSLSS
jgi:hypothetical protein